MTRAITLRLDDADHAALERRAQQLRVRPGTLARILVHAGLTSGASGVPNESALNALERLVQGSRSCPPADVVGLVQDAREGLTR